MNAERSAAKIREQEILVGPHRLPGILAIPDSPSGLVLFAHGSGSSRLSRRNQAVARDLQEAGIATLLFDLLTEDEAEDRRKVFDIELLAERLQEAADAVAMMPELQNVNLGYFGASTGAAAALVAAARQPQRVKAVVSRGGRPDLAATYLPRVRAATLLIVGGADEPVIEMNQDAAVQLTCECRLVIIAGATHLFPEPGALEEVSRLARDWFLNHLGSPAQSRGPGAVEETPPTESGDCAGQADPPLSFLDDFIGHVFRNREEAGRLLAAQLKGMELKDPLVLGVPRGGVVVGAALARELGAELDVVLSRKLRAPQQPELAIGAVAEDGSIYLTDEARWIEDLSDDYLSNERAYQMAEIERRRQLFRSVRPPARLEGRTVIVTDDGIATGSTIIAALEVIRAQHPHETIVAAPVAAPSRLEIIRPLCDKIVCLRSPEMFWGIGQFYADFTQIEDAQVVEILREFAEAARAREAVAPSGEAHAAP